jgi:3-oxoacyl-(acyl-carrier-protein) synthase
MSRISITGTGAVSAAGWGVEALVAALESGLRPEAFSLSRERKHGEPVVTPVLKAPAVPPTLPKSPRLRRVSPISKFAVAAAIEALGPDRIARIAAGELRLGVLCTLLNGCVNYSNRFFGEVLADPSVASPILFPETVFNAPSSHLSALFGTTAPNDTLLGDGAEIFTAVEIATEWLLRGDCDAVLVVASEELDWLSAEALGLYSKDLIPAEGAAAILFEVGDGGPRLVSVPDPVLLVPESDRTEAIRRACAATGALDDGRTLLSDSRTGARRFDRAEDAAYATWSGPQVSPKKILGESFAAAAGLQLVAAVESVKRGKTDQALVCVLGGNEQVGACLVARD